MRNIRGEYEKYLRKTRERYKKNYSWKNYDNPVLNMLSLIILSNNFAKKYNNEKYEKWTFWSQNSSMCCLQFNTLSNNLISCQTVLSTKYKEKGLKGGDMKNHWWYQTKNEISYFSRSKRGATSPSSSLSWNLNTRRNRPRPRPQVRAQHWIRTQKQATFPAIAAGLKSQAQIWRPTQAWRGQKWFPGTRRGQKWTRRARRWTGNCCCCCSPSPAQRLPPYSSYPTRWIHNTLSNPSSAFFSRSW